ncbi:MAG: glycosyl transferase family 2, partial [Vulcanisaeta sp.]|nr:glycosyl transferase family 2 [Vulcanisaeta sp.]
YSVGLLDSYVYELAPLNIMSFIRQRIRWNRGYVQNLWIILRQRVDVGYAVRVITMYILIALPPALLIVSAVGFITITYAAIITRAFAMGVVYQLVLVIALSEIAVLYLARNYIRESLGMGKALVLLPIYWFLLATVTVTSPLVPVNNWLKTVR